MSMSIKPNKELWGFVFGLEDLPVWTFTCIITLFQLNKATYGNVSTGNLKTSLCKVKIEGTSKIHDRR